MRKALYILSLVLATHVWAWASVQDRAAITASPVPLALTTDSDGLAAADISFRIPRQAMAKRGRIVITPQLLVGDSLVAEYRPVVADPKVFAKKMRRREELYNYVDTFRTVRSLVDRRRDTVFAYRLAAVLTAPGTARIAAVVSEDGCGACTGLDTLDLGTITRPMPAPRRRPVAQPDQAVPTPPAPAPHVPITGRGEARLQFALAKADIDLALGSNRAELQHMAEELRPIIQDTTAEIQEIRITGLASVDGPLPLNRKVALARARAAREWLCTELNLCEEQSRLITVAAKPEGWGPVIRAMQAAGHPQAAKVQQTVLNHINESDDVAERIIRRMPVWPDIRDRYLSSDRRVEYTYTYRK